MPDYSSLVVASEWHPTVQHPSASLIVSCYPRAACHVDKNRVGGHDEGYVLGLKIKTREPLHSLSAADECVKRDF